jgi:hypothetical protein
VAVLYKNYADALDVSEERARKMDEISLKHYGTAEARAKVSENLQNIREQHSTRLMHELLPTPLPATSDR